MEQRGLGAPAKGCGRVSCEWEGVGGERACPKRYPQIYLRCVCSNILHLGICGCEVSAKGSLPGLSPMRLGPVVCVHADAHRRWYECWEWRFPLLGTEVQ